VVSLSATLFVRMIAGPMVDRPYNSGFLPRLSYIHFQDMVPAKLWLCCLFLVQSLQGWLELRTPPTASTSSASSLVS